LNFGHMGHITKLHFKVRFNLLITSIAIPLPLAERTKNRVARLNFISIPNFSLQIQHIASNVVVHFAINVFKALSRFSGPIIIDSIIIIQHCCIYKDVLDRSLVGVAKRLPWLNAII